MDARRLSLLAIISASYAVLVVVFAPLSFGPIQLRIADSLIPLSAIFGWQGIIGVTLGCLVGNAYVGLGTLDLTLGPIANLVGALIIYLLRKRLLTGCILGSTAIGVIVGGYLWVIFPPPDIFGTNLPIWASMIISISASSLLAIAGIGYLLTRALTRIGNLKRQRDAEISVKQEKEI